MKEFVLATGNAHKLREVREILDGTGVTIRSMSEFPDVTAAIEDGETFEANAAKKAEHVARSTGRIVIADDSGLVVDALDGAPGVYSARYAGTDGDHVANCAKLLVDLAGVPERKRTARFVCVIAVSRDGKETSYYRGGSEGTILGALTGDGGFGYDPLFYSPELGCSFAEASAERKNGVSHRGRALSAFKAALEDGAFGDWF